MNLTQRESGHNILLSTCAHEAIFHHADSRSIVFIHGLNPQGKVDFANATWTHRNKNFWPTKQLPKRIPSARILIFSYNSRVAKDASKNGIEEHANSLLDRLAGARELGHADVDAKIYLGKIRADEATLEKLQCSYHLRRT